MDQITTFYILSGLIAGFSLAVVTLKNAVAAAICLVADLFLLAGIYVLLSAEFVAAIQVLIYAGAIVVLFTFVIMLLNFKPSENQARSKIGIWEKVTVGSLMLLMVSFGFLHSNHWMSEWVSSTGMASLPSAHFDSQDALLEIGLKLFKDYLWAFELASFVILLAVICVVLIAKKHDFSHESKVGNQ